MRRRGRQRGPARRGPARRGMRPRSRRRVRRRTRRRTRRLVFGTTAVLMVGGTAAAYKLNQKDIKKVEQHTAKSADDLTEAELIAAMKKLGIQQLELTDEDEAAMDRADAEDDEKTPSAVSPTTTLMAQGQDPMAMLKQLGELRAAGILTEDEFEAKKAEILSRM